MHPEQSYQDHRVTGFTLIELLVVISIIGILVAILLPSLMSARRTAMVLASPIAYIGADQKVYLTDVQGSRHILASEGRLNGPLKWSPDGRRIAGTAYRPVNGGLSAVVNPGAGTYSIFPNTPYGTQDWESNSTLLVQQYIGSGYIHHLLDADTGEIRQTLRTVGGPVSVHRDRMLSHRYFVSVQDSVNESTGDIYVLGQNWQKTRTIWSDPGENVYDRYPASDWAGEMVAWSRSTGSAHDGPWQIATKPLDSAATAPFRLLNTPYNDIVFGSWTPDGNLVASAEVSPGEWQLVVLDGNGNLIREIECPEGVTKENPPTYRQPGQY